MDAENRKKSSILIYLIPVFILAAWPAIKWLGKPDSGDIKLSEEDYRLFNSQEGEVRKGLPLTAGTPEFDEGILAVRYISPKNGIQAEKTDITERAPKKRTERKQTSAGNKVRGGQPTAGQNELNSIKAREQQSVGFTKGFLTSSVGKVMNNPKAVGAILSNKYVVSGFMSRGTVKAATGSPEGLANYLKSGGPANFINNPIVKAALNNPAVVSAVASSGLISAMLETPAAKALMNDPKALGDLITSNPELVKMAMSNPATLNMLMNNPEVSGIVSKFDTSEINRKP